MATDMESPAAELVTTGEAAEILGVGTKTVRRWSDAGHLPSARTPGSHRRFRRADVEALITFTEPTEAAS